MVLGLFFFGYVLISANGVTQEILEKKVKFKETNTTIVLNRREKCIEFNRELHYWIFNDRANIVKIGTGTQTDITNLYQGHYYICFVKPQIQVDSDGDGTFDKIEFGLDLENIPKYTCKFYVDWIRE